MILVLGERAIASDRVYDRDVYRDPFKYSVHLNDVVELRPHTKEMLDRVMPDGVEWRMSNLLAHHPIRNIWTRDEALKAARAFMLAVAKPAFVVCCGARVMGAFRPYYFNRPSLMGAAVVVRSSRVTFCRVPSPTPKNGQWTNDELIHSCKERLTDAYNRWRSQ